MRFPKLTELDKDQARVYQGAPVTGTILVMGPPGTGKTVIAFHRAHRLTKLNQSPTVIMFNKVLSKYTGKRQSVATNVDVLTFHVWAGKWWKRTTGRHKAPTVPGNPYDHDWGEIQKHVLSEMVNGLKPEKMHWGHLIIDEGQDFPEAMYSAMHTMMSVANSMDAKPPLAMTVLADENQRLQPGRNSSLENIRKALGLHSSDQNVFCLTKNYRNTLEIAKFAGTFYIGLRTGMPQLPDRRRGSRPVISVSAADSEGKNLNAFAEKISRYVRNRPAEEVGVLVPNNKIRASMVNRLNAKLKSSEVIVQSYASGDDTARAEDLEFDTPGRVTVLNFQSAKGLEFDSVFVVDLGQLISGGASEVHAKMTLYVMCSRARSYLELMFVKDGALENFMSWLPTTEDQFSVEDL